MLSIYCSIEKASVFAALGSCMLVMGRANSAANAREKRELFLIRVPLFQSIRGIDA
jgi:hypothetical protein